MMTDFKFKLSIGMGTFGALLNVKLTRWNVSLNQSRRNFLRKVKELLKFFKAMKTIMNGNVDGSEGFHGVVTDA